eukprot:CAMPEP_0171815862 /NCGR_PEP_ID=MMETSP0992-20121227/155_1 /TAXON_ID=483369 /ORGANISM="non described non described, Strain CCMP2098" /LENGTH=42 /DNA_ID= /DNA_START= /DNA_END= /DNA_ORIENTATION=
MLAWFRLIFFFTSEHRFSDGNHRGNDNEGEVKIQPGQTTTTK